MAKPFYSMEEACAKLSKSEDELRAMVRAGDLREFRDAGKIFFKAEDIDKLGGGDASSDTGEISLEPVEEELPTLADTGGGTSVIGLEPVDEDKPEEKEDTVISASGIGVFDDDELEIDADPMAKTQITDAPLGDQVQLETSSGSGSGLLDLTREADDTSLGAELLDEIYPGEEEPTQAAAPARQEEPEEEEEQAAEEPAVEAAAVGEVIIPVTNVVGDPSEPILGGLLAGTLILIALAGSVAGAVLQGFMPDYALFLTKNFLMYFLPGAVVVLGLSVALGWLLGRATARR
ncbi:MAG: helix-turn-helix domain-containing protein [Phycisphaerae bacterium]|nr:helix-turn-helix domain-containing protein [Phycisphaerae bacterium]